GYDYQGMDYELKVEATYDGSILNYTTWSGGRDTSGDFTDATIAKIAVDSGLEEISSVEFTVTRTYATGASKVLTHSSSTGEFDVVPVIHVSGAKIAWDSAAQAAAYSPFGLLTDYVDVGP